MEELKLPVIKKLYELYKLFYSYRVLVPKQDRFAIWQQCDNIMLDIFENAMFAVYSQKLEKNAILKHVSKKLNVLRILIRLMKETSVLDNKKYIALQEYIDEIGRMIGGWMRSEY
mgnify:CR=1 FL=1